MLEWRKSTDLGSDELSHPLFVVLLHLVPLLQGLLPRDRLRVPVDPSDVPEQQQRQRRRLQVMVKW